MKEKIHGDEHTLLVLLYTYFLPWRFPYSPTPAIICVVCISPISFRSLIIDNNLSI